MGYSLRKREGEGEKKRKERKEEKKKDTVSSLRELKME